MEKKSQQPSAPKRPINSFMIYRQQVYEEVKKENSDLKLTEITKLIGEQFRNLGEKEKEKLNNKAMKLKQQYESDMAEYTKKYGEPPKKSRSKSSERKSAPKEKLKKTFERLKSKKRIKRVTKQG